MIKINNKKLSKITMSLFKKNNIVMTVSKTPTLSEITRFQKNVMIAAVPEMIIHFQEAAEKTTNEQTAQFFNNAEKALTNIFLLPRMERRGITKETTKFFMAQMASLKDIRMQLKTKEERLAFDEADKIFQRKEKKLQTKREAGLQPFEY